MNKKKNEKKQLTPMMQQYMQLKEEHPDCLLFFRLGDFYELFFDDAITASKELEITLTGRDCGLEERAPMCGVPHHAVDSYLKQLIEKGYKVAIGEQLTEPSDSPGIVERGVVRIVTPGTIIESQMLESSENNYIMAISLFEEYAGISYADISTGEFYSSQIKKPYEETLLDEIKGVQPAECVVIEGFGEENEKLLNKISSLCLISEFASWAFDPQSAEKNITSHFRSDGIADLDLKKDIAAISSSSALLAYINDTQKNSLDQINSIRRYQRENYMIVDSLSKKNLELFETISGKNKKKGSLFGLLDNTSTSMGTRKLRAWIDKPLFNKDDIIKRQDAIEEISINTVFRDRIIESLKKVYDIERLAGKLSGTSFNARDAQSLNKSLKELPSVKMLILALKNDAFREISDEFDTLEDICKLLENAIHEDPPVTLKEGSLIKNGYNEQIDALREIESRSKEWLDNLEVKEKEATGIKNLKIGYNRVFGYYIEVTKSYLEKVPFRYQRKQTLANAERYFTEELKEIERQILGASDKLIVLEHHIFLKIRELLLEHITRIQKSASILAQIDCFVSLAIVNIRYNYTRPEILEDNLAMEIVEGRHPVVEQNKEISFVPNDTFMDDNSSLMIITGPNMAGKSTYMRQVALITLLAHIGSFVPAKKAIIPLIDRIFTRVGASDDLSSGRSTFMVEMSETAYILQNATKRSLLLLDEIGRGTSTFDGLSIAWAVCEHVADQKKCGAKTIFATHYHELTELESILKGAVNYRILAKEMGDDVVFLRKVVRGGSDKSYGIQVARLAGLPKSVVVRAKKILNRLEKSDINHPKPEQLAILGVENDENNEEYKDKKLISIAETIENVDIDAITPREALDMLYKLKKDLSEK